MYVWRSRCNPSLYIVRKSGIIAWAGWGKQVRVQIASVKMPNVERVGDDVPFCVETPTLVLSDGKFA